MDYKELLKKYWFVGLIGILLIVFIGVYAADSIKNKEPVVGSKQIDGKYVVYSVDGDYTFADEFYDSLYKQNGLNYAFTAYKKAVVNKAYETTQEMNDAASYNASAIYQQYGEEYVLSVLNQNGYVNGIDDLANFIIDQNKEQLLISDYFKANQDKYVKPYIEENDPRIIYHILVMVSDITSSTDENGNEVYTANPTEEETAKLNQILEALKTQPFDEVAAQFSEDGSAQQGGYIGCISKANQANYYPVFSNKAMELGNDEVSDVITSQVGYHILWNAGNSAEALLDDSSFVSDLVNTKPTAYINAYTEKAAEFNIEIVDEDLKELFDSMIQYYQEAEASMEEQSNIEVESEVKE